MGRFAQLILGRADCVSNSIRRSRQQDTPRTVALPRGIEAASALARCSGYRGRQGVFELTSEAEVIDSQTAGAVAKDAVHAAGGLHYAVALHWFVGTRGAQAGRVEAGQPRTAGASSSRTITIWNRSLPLLPPRLGAQRQLIQFGPRFAPSWVMLLKDGDEALAVCWFQQVDHFVDDHVFE